jgi:hypothetical protein
MPRRHAIVITGAVAALTLGAWACGLTADFSHLQDGPPRDAGADSGEVDTGVDATVDVGTDAALDGGPDGAADACTVDSYCSSLSAQSAQPTFCSDFDDCRFPGPWTDYLHTPDAGQLSLDHRFFSPPNSLLAEDFMGTQQLDLADLRRTLPPILPPTSTLAFRFEIRPISVSMGGAAPLVVVAAIDFLDSDAGASNHLQFTLVRSATLFNLELDELSPGCGGSSGFQPHSLGQALQQDQWTGVRLTVKRAGTPPTASVSFEEPGSISDAGTLVLSDTPLCANVDATQIRIGIGSLYKDPTAAAWTNLFDNVTFYVTP